MLNMKTKSNIYYFHITYWTFDSPKTPIFCPLALFLSQYTWVSFIALRNPETRIKMKSDTGQIPSYGSSPADSSRLRDYVIAGGSCEGDSFYCFDLTLVLSSHISIQEDLEHNNFPSLFAFSICFRITRRLRSSIKNIDLSILFLFKLKYSCGLFIFEWHCCLSRNSNFTSNSK